VIALRSCHDGRVTHATALDPTRCPLCGQANECANQVELATGVKQSSCWCTQLTFDPVLFDRLPEAARRKICICPACQRSGGR
jgi:hypothetical protein